MCEIGFELGKELIEFKKKLKELSERKQELIIRLSNVDKKITDIEHCAEFYKLDAHKGYKLYKILHETTLERREIKNELQVICSVIDTIGDKIDKSIVSYDKAQREKSYTPRVVDELFDLLK